ncbi:hypothetical protein ACWGJT_19260 [Streptomyces xantholiticus]
MHSDIHLMLHGLRAGELHRAAGDHLPQKRLRAQLGHVLVKLGLRLLRQPPAPAGCTARLA